MAFRIRPDPSLTTPLAPRPPPSRPSGGFCTRSKVANSAKGAASRLPTTMVWPSPPRVRPAPPESWRSSFFQTTSGVIASVTSTGTFLTPDGNGVADRPSSVGRAPAPPECRLIIMKLVRFRPKVWSVRPWPAPAFTPHSEPVPSAGTSPGRIWCRQPNTASGRRWPTTERTATAHGNGALTIVFSGAVTLMRSSDAALFGTFGATTHLTAKEA